MSSFPGSASGPAAFSPYEPHGPSLGFGRFHELPIGVEDDPSIRKLKHEVGRESLQVRVQHDLLFPNEKDQ